MCAKAGKIENLKPRLAVIGLEGSGKTVMAVTMAKRLSVISKKG